MSARDRTGRRSLTIVPTCSCADTETEHRSGGVEFGVGVEVAVPVGADGASVVDAIAVLAGWVTVDVRLGCYAGKRTGLMLLSGSVGRVGALPGPRRVWCGVFTIGNRRRPGYIRGVY